MHTHDHNRTPEELLERLHDISLPTAERERMRQALASYADFHPVRAKAPPGRVFAGFHLSFARRYVFALALFAVIGSLTGGISYAAESAVPGMILYPVKTRVNERVIGLLSFSDEAAIEWQTELILRRIDEAERLAVSNTLDATTEASLRTQIAANIEKVVLDTQTLDRNGRRDTAASVRTDIEASLRAHADILTALGTHSAADDTDEKTPEKKKEDGVLDSFITSLREQRHSVAEARKEAREVETDMADTARAYLATAEKSVAEARRAIDRIDEHAQTTLVAQAKTRLDVAEKRLRAAQTAFEEEQYAQAIRDAEKATFSAKETSVFAASARTIDISAELDFSSITEDDEDETEHEEPTHDTDKKEDRKEKEEDAHKRSDENTDSIIQDIVDVEL
ncbi:hypothetical protein HY416_02085 [Candidatus Kaiserbacteria bacterium]|nr:hypothetical protein [Candidatus Kaiserbacteria bacterium]